MSPQERAAYIKDELRKQNIRQYTIARALGVSDPAVNRCINGNRSSGRIARAISEAIGKPFEDLFPEIADREAKRAEMLLYQPEAVFVDPAEVEILRKTVKKRMVDLNLDRRGSYEIIIPHMRIPVSINILSMTLTGYRSGRVAKAILEELLSVLAAWPPRAA